MFWCFGITPAGAVFDNPGNIQKSCHNFKQTTLTCSDPVIKQNVPLKNDAQKRLFQEEVSVRRGGTLWLKRKENHFCQNTFFGPQGPVGSPRGLLSTRNSRPLRIPR